MTPHPGLVLAIGFAAETVRESSPFVHCVAPRAATSFVADVLYGAGARSVITGTTADALAAADSADAVMFDLGTLTSEWSDAINPTLAAVRQAEVPWVLDATPIGRLPLRVDRVRTLLGHRPSVVRAATAELDGGRLDVSAGALAIGEPLAETVFVDGDAIGVPQGSPLLAQVPGVRSAVTALVAACAAVAGPAEAALCGAAWVALASERAEGHGRGPASFRVALIDELALVRGDEIAEYLHLG